MAGDGDCIGRCLDEQQAPADMLPAVDGQQHDYVCHSYRSELVAAGGSGLRVLCHGNPRMEAVEREAKRK